MVRVLRILITGARSPVAVHILRLLSAAGHYVILSDHLTHPLGAASVRHQGFYTFPSFRISPEQAGASLLGLIKSERIDIVIPTCEEVFYLAQFWRSHDIQARLLAPPFPLLEQVHNKYAFIELCKKIGLSVPKTRLILSNQDIEPLVPNSEKLVFKPIWSRFASQVLLRPNANKLNQINATQEQPWIAQDYLEGQEICVYAIAHNGQLTALSAYQGLIRAGLGAAVTFEPVSHPEIRRFIETFVSATNWTGQISFDLMQDDTGVVRPLECNPRATSGAHFFASPEQFSSALLTGEVEAIADIANPQGVRLAVWIYGLGGLFRKHSFGALWHAIRETKDVLKTSDDPIGLIPQLRSVMELTRIAMRRRSTLQEASSYDIEWNGPHQSDISK